MTSNEIMKVEDTGSSGATDCIGREFTLQELNATANQKQNESHTTTHAMAPQQSVSEQSASQSGPKMIITEPGSGSSATPPAESVKQKTVMVKNQKARIFSIVAAAILAFDTILDLIFGFSYFVSFPNILYHIVDIFLIVCLFRGKKDKILIVYPIFRLVMNLVSLFTGVFGLYFIITVLGNISLLLLFASCLNIDLPKSNNFNADKIKKLWFIPFLIFLFSTMYGNIVSFTEYPYFWNFLSYIVWPLIITVAYYLLIPLWLVSPTEIERSVTVSKPTNTANATTNINEGYTDLLKHILLLFFTFGVWYLIWIHKVTALLDKNDETESTSATTQLLLCMFVPFYIIYWTYKSTKKIEAWASKRGVPSDINTLCLILSLVFPIATPIIMQEKINSIVTAAPVQAHVQTAYTPMQYTPQTVTVPVSQETTETDVGAEINKFKELLDKGIITQEDFDQKKKQLLGL